MQSVFGYCKYLTACDRIAVIKDKLYFYNEGNDDSVTKKSDPRQMTVALAWIEMYDICCNKGYDSLREKAAVKAVNPAKKIEVIGEYFDIPFDAEGNLTLFTK